MTALRRMSAGQIITALSFVVSGFVQMSIDDKITPIPDYGNEDWLHRFHISYQAIYWRTKYHRYGPYHMAMRYHVTEP